MLAHSQTRIAMGSPTTLTIVSDSNQTTVDELFRELWLQIFTFERRFSRFLPASELTQFNRAAGARQAVSPEFRDMLLAARQMADLTDGLYNPFILPALQRAGYVKSMVSAHEADETDDYTRRSVVQPDKLEISDTWATIPYGTALDLGGCGKGYAGDLLAGIVDRRSDIAGYWFSLGGDVVGRGYDGQGKPWAVQIENVAREHGIAGFCRTAGKEQFAVATSSTLRRKGIKAGKPWHHLIDPRTNRPARTDTPTASVSAASALLADALASCAVIQGSKSAVAYAAGRGAQGVLLQTEKDSVISWGNLTPATRKASVVTI